MVVRPPELFKEGCSALHAASDRCHMDKDLGAQSSGPKGHSHPASPGAQTEMRAHRDLCLREGHQGFSPSLFCGLSSSAFVRSFEVKACIWDGPGEPSVWSGAQACLALSAWIRTQTRPSPQPGWGWMRAPKLSFQFARAPDFQGGSRDGEGQRCQLFDPLL